MEYDSHFATQRLLGGHLLVEVLLLWGPQQQVFGIPMVLGSWQRAEVMFVRCCQPDPYPT